MFVIARSGSFATSLEFYCGKTYIYQGEYYGIFDVSSQNAKMYSSHSRAIQAMERLSNKLGDVLTVVSLNDL